MNLMSPDWTGGGRCSEDADDVLPQHPWAQAGETSSCHTSITSMGRAREAWGETESFWH